jgi:thioester reductase-like protein
MSDHESDIVLFTGFPGFLASALLPRVLARLAAADAVCLVQPQHATLARARVAALVAADESLCGRIRLIEGDITNHELGLIGRIVPRRVIEIFHLAAIYDLSVKRDLAMRVNVLGTQHALDFARECRRLRRFQYVSTCYVSGRWRGTFTEAMLEEGQQFNNFYEETKQLAEVAVRQAIRAGLPVTIYRPAIVVGDSTTGETQKYDGPYFALQWLLRQPRVAVMPVVGDKRRREFNVVPRDYVVDAIAWLSGRVESMGRTYALADPRPLTVDAMLDAMARATGRRMLRVPLPLGVAKGLITWVPGVKPLLRIPAAAVDYFVHPTHYDTANVRSDMASSGITCPALPSYLDTLVAWMRAHPEVGSSAMT